VIDIYVNDSYDLVKRALNFFFGVGRFAAAFFDCFFPTNTTRNSKNKAAVNRRTPKKMQGQ